MPCLFWLAGAGLPIGLEPSGIGELFPFVIRQDNRHHFPSYAYRST
jgi:hypothetical protein